MSAKPLLFFIFLFLADTEITQQDLLTCGSCQKPFPLADIVKFIQHKIIICNKENYSLGYVTSGETCDDNSDDGGSSGPGHPLGVVNSRRPSISAPINSKKSSTPNQVRLVCSPPSTSPKIPEDEATTSTPKRRAGSSSPLGSKDDVENHLSEDDIKPRIKQEMDAGSSPDDVKKIRGVDAESNTTHSGKSEFICHRGRPCPRRRRSRVDFLIISQVSEPFPPRTFFPRDLVPEVINGSLPGC
ncbi:UNVERIFIED_CONTAM: hypothetical protein PYX00_009317 [Menopon gallinae]|uniref:BCL-11A-like CCHC zinc finger domain-containing protein n=1 Tax=Menopon gallinae TaxID=328185 RepID=A0AAW2HB39_9NEOP